ncbi:hypothetical protein J6590_044580 [Homalodisca vitripennis]|nr:hypothetical protein J6590_044580 [Homalodisca vitripennis]
MSCALTELCYLSGSLRVTHATHFSLYVKDNVGGSRNNISHVLAPQHYSHRGFCRGITDNGDKRSLRLHRSPGSTHTDGTDLPYPVKVLPNVAVPRQELTQVEVNLPVTVVHPGVMVSDETKGSTIVGTLVPPLLQNLAVPDASFRPSSGKAKGRPSLYGELVVGNDSCHNHDHRILHRVVCAVNPKRCSPLDSQHAFTIPFGPHDTHPHFCDVQTFQKSGPRIDSCATPAVTTFDLLSTLNGDDHFRDGSQVRVPPAKAVLSVGQGSSMALCNLGLSVLSYNSPPSRAYREACMQTRNPCPADKPQPNCLLV